MIRGTETEYRSKMEIDLDGSKFGTNNGTTDLIKFLEVCITEKSFLLFAPET